MGRHHRGEGLVAQRSERPCNEHKWFEVRKRQRSEKIRRFEQRYVLAQSLPLGWSYLNYFCACCHSESPTVEQGRKHHCVARMHKVYETIPHVFTRPEVHWEIKKAVAVAKAALVQNSEKGNRGEASRDVANHHCGGARRQFRWTPFIGGRNKHRIENIP